MSFYVYILDVRNYPHIRKKWYYENIFYTGMTGGVSKRYREHLLGVNSSFLKRCYPNSKKKLVYVEIMNGDYKTALRREREVKRMSRKKKKELVCSDLNVLGRVEPNYGHPKVWSKTGVEL